jgi:hypothetical protein
MAPHFFWKRHRPRWLARWVKEYASRAKRIDVWLEVIVFLRRSTHEVRRFWSMFHAKLAVVALLAFAAVLSIGCSGDHGATKSGGSATPAPTQSGYYVAMTNELAAPPAGTGIHIETPDYDANDPNAKQLVVQPGQEIFLCYYVTLPNTAEIDIGGFQSWMSPGSSHHFIVYQQGTGPFASGLFAQAPQPNGTITTCGFGTGTWVYATSTPGEVVGMNFPESVGLPFAAGTQINLNMHFINPSSMTLYPKVKLNILFAKNVKDKAAVMVSFNRQIDVPAATSSGPGTQTVSGTCTAPAGSKFFTMSTHTHKHATAAVIQFVSGGKSREIVHTGSTQSYPLDQVAGSGTDWEHPGVAEWTAPDFLTVQQGDSFAYSCSYTNTGSTNVTVGETAASNEMCMAVGYYFPAGMAYCN